MKVFVEKNSKNLELKFNGQVDDLLKELEVNSEEVIIVRNGTLVTTDEKLDDKDKIEILSVVSGG